MTLTRGMLNQFYYFMKALQIDRDEQEQGTKRGDSTVRVDGGE
jgi:hypothetical protein